MTLNHLRDEAHSTAKIKGWHDRGNHHDRLPELLLMVHAEVSEAVEAYRCAKADPMAEVGKELADVIIRVLDICGLFGIDIDDLVHEKMQFNKGRPWRHGGKLI